MLPGTIYMAAKDLHLKASRGVAYVQRGEPIAGHRPSGTTLFESLAGELGPRAIGALLTGMGEDGAEGLLALKKAGGYTLVESERTAVVYGMPAAAVRLEAERESLPLDEIAGRLRALVMLEGAGACRLARARSTSSKSAGASAPSGTGLAPISAATSRCSKQ